MQRNKITPENPLGLALPVSIRRAHVGEYRVVKHETDKSGTFAYFVADGVTYVGIVNNCHITMYKRSTWQYEPPEIPIVIRKKLRRIGDTDHTLVGKPRRKTRVKEHGTNVTYDTNDYATFRTEYQVGKVLVPPDMVQKSEREIEKHAIKQGELEIRRRKRTEKKQLDETNTATISTLADVTPMKACPIIKLDKEGNPYDWTQCKCGALIPLTGSCLKCGKSKKCVEYEFPTKWSFFIGTSQLDKECKPIQWMICVYDEHKNFGQLHGRLVNSYQEGIQLGIDYGYIKVK